ncbi:2-oxo acid dehydrogenase subunit E2 [Rhizobium sp. BK399]|uniref:dihydrolipoamide acetyltransferase family protein n=1 Tax=Rhizobium sp. BK399 TaxID=2587063 RepID=UPI0016078C7B|nr:2-oxo acid dehydrogenase subunit E2 [Rhizobium sp. BK399]MBB3544317.1 2-oxoglutarate dehydrogenase E2 component (dihydrolipoamide succinyltransferase) [Rhizobium sp. BK399]
MANFIEVLVPLEQEGTTAVVRNWLKQAGDAVAEDDALVEIETDKVTQEIPAPVAGILAEILMMPGADATPGAVLARIRADHALPDQGTCETAENETIKGDNAPVCAGVGTLGSERLSPAVRSAFEEYGIDPANVVGTGRNGRVTRMDMDNAFLARKSPGGGETPSDTDRRQSDRPPASSRIVAHTPMRLSIARHMLESVTTAPHVTSIFEADFTAVMRHRAMYRAEFAAEGIDLSYSSYIVAACAAAMRAVPEVNSRWHDDHLEIFDDLNIGIGVALGDSGLVVPVIHRAQDLDLSDVAARLQDITMRGRDGKLTNADMRGGTFTISNHGVSGSLVAAPIIINQPQSAILGVGKIEKRVVVRIVDGVDAIQIRPMAYVSLTIDHRALDAHQTNAWLTRFVETLEAWDASQPSHPRR